MGRHAAHRRTYRPALAAMHRIPWFLPVPGGRPVPGLPRPGFHGRRFPGRCPCAGIFPGLDSSRAGAFPVREFTAGAFPDGCAVREPDPRDRRDRGVERFGGQHEEYRRFAPAALLCHPEALQYLFDRRRRLVERPDQHRPRQPRADAQCGIRQGVLEARPAVGVGRVVAVQPAQQGDLRPDRVERRLDERRRVEHPLFVGDQRVEEFLAVGDAPSPVAVTTASTAARSPNSNSDSMPAATPDFTTRLILRRRFISGISSLMSRRSPAPDVMQLT